MKLRTTKLQEHHIYLLLIVVMNLLYIYAASVARPDWFGFSQLRHIGMPGALICPLGTGILIVLVNRVGAGAGSLLSTRVLPRARSLFSRLFAPTPRSGRVFYIVMCVVLSCLFVFLFWSFRNYYINYDARMYEVKFRQDVPLRGAHVTHDEMWELYLHSRFWYYMNRYRGWSVIRSYQLLSALGGGVFILILLTFTKVVRPRRSWQLFFLIVSGGFMQLFFGDVENYTLTSTLMMLYFLAAYLFLKEKMSIVLPSMILSLALCFHLLAGWLLPSLLYLYFISAKRRQHGQMALGVISSSAIVSLTLLFFHFHGLPIRDLLYHSHALAHGGNLSLMIAGPSLERYLELVNVLFLMFPFVLVLIPLLLFKRIDTNLFNAFLIVSALFMLIFMLVWRPWASVYDDWDLFAPCIIPLTLLCWCGFVRINDLRYKRAIYSGMVFTSMLHSYCWIIANHSPWGRL